MNNPLVKFNISTLLYSKFTILLISLILLILLPPFLEERLILKWSFGGLTLFVFINVMFMCQDAFKFLLFFVITALISLFFNLAEIFMSQPIISAIGELFFALFCMGAIILFAREVFSSGKVTRDTILGAICVYLLIGVVYAMIYTMLEMLNPGSLINASSGIADKLSDFDFYYFSFITLTTVGYGDIDVLSTTVKSVVILESITGIFYLAILVARLVAKENAS